MKLCFKSLHTTVKIPPSQSLRPAPPSNPEWFQCITSCSPVTHRNIFSERQERQERQKRQERHAGEIISPAPPCFCLAASLLRQAGVRMQSELPKRCPAGQVARLGVLGGRCSVCVRSAGVSCRTHLRWPTPVRPAPDSRVKGKDFQILGENVQGGGGMTVGTLGK